MEDRDGPSLVRVAQRVRNTLEVVGAHSVLLDHDCEGRLGLGAHTDGSYRRTDITGRLGGTKNSGLDHKSELKWQTREEERT